MKKLYTVVLLLIPLFMAGEQTTIGYFGVLSEPISDVMMTALDIEHGVVITKVYEATPAYDAGFEVGDILIEIDGQAIPDIATLKAVVADRPNKKVTVEYLRSGSHKEKSVTLGEKEKEIFQFNLEIPDMENFKKALETGREEFQEQLDNLEKEIENLKQEIEDIKKQMQEH